ncbi:hypothetical protein QR685DRAFT_446562 [Neurospora intermedia]|uniref:Uncharacterized protein n=1 Tax=Neurospora intermedia TaxID=5142 RepID=A0ABR3D779_NEUIN
MCLSFRFLNDASRGPRRQGIGLHRAISQRPRRPPPTRALPPFSPRCPGLDGPQLLLTFRLCLPGLWSLSTLSNSFHSLIFFSGMRLVFESNNRNRGPLLEIN